MQELIRSNDPIRISFIQALLSDAGIESLLLDNHTSIMEGSIGIIPRRLMVADDDLSKAHHVLVSAGEAHQ